MLKYLTELGDSIVTRIRGNMAAKGMNVTGKTSKSLRYEVTQAGPDTRLRVYGSGVILTLETGRGPTKNRSSSGPRLFDILLEWVRARGIDRKWNMPLRSATYIITRSIHERGTLTYRQFQRTGKGSGVISEILNDREIQKISKKVLNLGGEAILNRSRQSLREKPLQ